MKIYKIKNKKTGLYSTGGLYARWSKSGKVWKAIGHLKNHLDYFTKYPDMFIDYADAEVVELETTENWSIPVARFVKMGTNIFK